MHSYTVSILKIIKILKINKNKIFLNKINYRLYFAILITMLLSTYTYIKLLEYIF